MWHDLVIAYAHALELPNLLCIIGGSLLGILVGAFPALDTAVAAALLVPLTFGMTSTQAILMLTAVYCAGVYAGQIPAILFRIPGSTEAVMTTLDGYELTKKGRADEALGIGLTASVFGGIFGTLMLTFATPPLAKIALAFGPAEYFALGIFGLSALSGVGGTSVIKGLTCGLIGLLLATVGIDAITGMARFTFGSKVLLGGISFIPAVIGLFAGAEVFKQVALGGPISESERDDIISRQKIRIKLPSLSQLNPLKWTLLKSGFIGGLIGMLPGVGATTAAIVGYGQAARSSKHPETFGKGDPEGIAAAEMANNAAAPAAMIPLLSLGIPGSAITAIILGAFMLHGLRPGPLFMMQQKDLAFIIFAGVLLSQLVFFAAAFAAVIPFIKLRTLPRPLLIVFILSFAILGTAAMGGPSAMPTMVVLGIFGYILERCDFPLAPVVFGLVLGPIIEKSLRRALMIAQYDIIVVLARPITLALLLGAVFFVLIPLLRGMSKKGRGQEMTVAGR